MSKEIYILTAGIAWEGYSNIGVYSTYEKAMEAKKREENEDPVSDYDIETWEVE